MKIIFQILMYTSLYFNTAIAAIDFSQFYLTDSQVNLLKNFEKKGYTEKKLLKFAKGMEKYNREQEYEEYIPPHTDKLLEEVSNWAIGGAFSAYASFAGVKFDSDSYKKDCPNWAIFNFSRATGTEHLKIDLLNKAISISHALQSKLVKDLSPEKLQFREDFLTMALDLGFSKYIIL